MDEHKPEPKRAEGPDPLLSPLHEGQLSFISEPEPTQHAPEPSESPSWSPIASAATSSEPDESVVAGDTEAPEVASGAEEASSLESEDSTAQAEDAHEDDIDPSSPDVSEDDSIEDAAFDEPAHDDDLASDEEPDESDIESAGAEGTETEGEPGTVAGAVPAEAVTEAAWPSLETPSAGPSLYDLPALDRPRPTRDRFVPKWAYIALASVVAALVLIAGGVFWYLSASRVVVPDVTGVQLSVAKTRLERAGLGLKVTDERFSSEPRNEVLAQTPGSGGELRRGGVVNLVISAGTEEVVMPDVVGDGLALARAELERRGLVVIVDAVPSDVPSDTVLGTTPAAGSVVRTGDSVRLAVAAPVGGSNGLSPYNMQGLGVVLDPAPSGGATDTTMEVARRLRSLLEASGASVSVLRSATDTAAPDSIRAQAATSATGTIGLGFSIAAGGPAGRHVSIPVTGTPDVLQRSQLLSSSIASQLAGVAPPVSSSTSSTETVLVATRLPWARIVLGSGQAREDQTRFADPAWADQMARAIYNALGELYGVRE